MRKQGGLPAALTTTHSLIRTQNLKLHVYKKTLQALLYPVSSTTPHKFVTWTATSLTYCYECHGLLWGLARQGKRCTECGVKCHEKCQELFNADCLHNSLMKKKKQEASKVENVSKLVATAVEERMSEIEETNKNKFLFLHDALNITDAKERKTCLQSAKDSVVEGTSKWSARITVTVLSAKGLEAKDRTGSSDPYVSVQVGKVRKRTKTIYGDLCPSWNEKFTFDCNNSTDRIKVRVWDEDDDIKSRLKQRITRECDDFLGQTIIEVRTLYGDTDVWYNLQKRTDKSAVSGSIQLRINMEVNGEKNVASFYVQYSFLHENIFQFVCSQNDGMFKIPHVERKEKETDDKSWKVFFEGHAQEIVHEFSLRYGVELIYQAMTHFSCLSWKYKCTGVPALMSTILTYINSHYIRTIQEYGCNRFQTSGFETERFVKVIDSLHNSFRVDLSMYRKLFPSSDQESLKDMKITVDLLTSISFFKMKVQEQRNAPKACQVVRDCCKACVVSTYEHIYAKCSEEESLAHENDTKETSGKYMPESNDIKFWKDIMREIGAVITEDCNVYAPVLNHFPNELNVGNISAAEMWSMLAEDVHRVVLQHDTVGCSLGIADYMNLQFCMIEFYKQRVAHLDAFQGTVPEFYRWFEPFPLAFLDTNEKELLSVVLNAYRKDKETGFQSISKTSLFSSSVIDIFTAFNEYNSAILSQLQCPDLEIHNKYMRRLVETVNKMVKTYADIVMGDIPNFCQQYELSCKLMNNIFKLAFRVEMLYKNMGGDTLDTEIRQQFEEIQSLLNDYLNKISTIFAAGFTTSIEEGVKELRELLSQVKETTNNLTSRDKGSASPTLIVGPLLDPLSESVRMLHGRCEKRVFKRILHEIWKGILRSIENIIVLPPLSDLTGSQLLLSAAKELGQFSKFKDMKRGNPCKTLTPKQCDMMRECLDEITNFFDDVASDVIKADKSKAAKSNKKEKGTGVRIKNMKKTEEYKTLMSALSMYTQSTDQLVQKFVEQQKKQGRSRGKAVVGELFVEVGVHDPFGTGERKVDVKVISAKNLKWRSNNKFQPFVEVNIVGPRLNDRQRKFATKSKNNTWSPSFNETFTFTLNKRVLVSWYELHFSVKDYYFAREDHTVGVATLLLDEVAQQSTPTFTCKISLFESFSIEQAEWILLRILSLRTGDEIAREFVQLKSSRRSPEEKPHLAQ